MAAIELDEQAASEDGETTEMKEEATLQARLDDAFERTNDEAGEEASTGDETEPATGSSVEEGQPAQQEPAPLASGAVEPAETEASPHGEKRKNTSDDIAASEMVVNKRRKEDGTPTSVSSSVTSVPSVERDKTPPLRSGGIVEEDFEERNTDTRGRLPEGQLGSSWRRGEGQVGTESQ